MRTPTAFGGEVNQDRPKRRSRHVAPAPSMFLFIAGALLARGAQQAAALPIAPFAVSAPSAIVKVMCKYGTPHCVNPNPGPGRPKAGGAEFPNGGWTDPDCKYYGNCNTGTSPQNWGDPSIARKGPSRSARPGALHPVHAGSPKAK